jgi:tRNA dimethylallyltransferase
VSARPQPKAILIAGPTASGKSALALAVARAHGGVVVNVDSMQVYGDLRVLSARPTPAEEAAVPHRLYGDVDGAENHSVGRFLARAAPLLADLVAERRLPVLVGGTGLYFKALCEGLSAVPDVPDDVRARVRGAAEGIETPALHARLAACDPHGAAALHPADRLRILRALEVLEATGRPLASFRAARARAPLDGVPTLALFLDAEREALRARIDARFLAMMETGALDEVARLRARALDPMLPVMRAHGVPALIAHLAGQLSRAEAIAIGQADTRRYAKRQYTFFRHQMGGAFALTAPEAARGVIEAALA